MKISLDVSLANPRDHFDLEKIKLFPPRNTYELMYYKPNMFIVYREITNQISLRIHKDGRIYIKCENDKDITTGNVFVELYNNLKSLIILLGLDINENFKLEYRYGIFGSKAHSTYWKNYEKIKSLGYSSFESYSIKTYDRGKDKLFIKIQPN